MQSTPTGQPQPRRSGVGPAIGAGIGGLVLGLVLAGGVYAAGILPYRAPRPIPVSLEAMPVEFMGLKRDDLANPERAARISAAQNARVEEFRKAFGGAGLDVTYGAVDGDHIQLWLQNGALGGIVTTPDAQLTNLEAVMGWIEAPATATTRCAVSNYPAVTLTKPVTAAAITAGKERALGSREGVIVCTRRDTLRNFTVEATADSPKTTRSLTLAEASRRLAEAVDGVFTSVVR